ncbi:MAG: hypothetical protein JO194_03775 [Candidatus Eremiobacteraeota bacterium]|nr:hypothetical protein [Candidatus Eremiobacteraeota bacterium]
MLIAAKIAPSLTSAQTCLKDATSALVYASDTEHASGTIIRDLRSDIREKRYVAPYLTVTKWQERLLKQFPELAGKVKQDYEAVAGEADESLKYSVKQNDETLEVFAVRREIKDVPGINKRTFTEHMFAVIKGTSECKERAGIKLTSHYKEFEFWLMGDYSYDMIGATFKSHSISGMPTGGVISLNCCADKAADKPAGKAADKPAQADAPKPKGPPKKR